MSYFDRFWWIVIFGTWIWPKSQSLTFQCTIDFLAVDYKFHLSIQWNCNVLNHVIRSRWYKWNLVIMIQINWSFARSKIINYPFSVKTLILTILPFWWFDQISWGIVVQTWSNDKYESKMLIVDQKLWSLNINWPWLTFPPQYNWFLGQLLNWLTKNLIQGLKLDMSNLGGP